MKRALIVCALLFAFAHAAHAQSTVADLTMAAGDAPVRLVGYGLVVGLDGSGDRAVGGFGARHTVQSVVNLLRNFDVGVPAELLRTRNVAAVLVTAEVSSYLRDGGRFDVSVASLGDAQSLRGGQLWITPLVSAPGGPALATAQGALTLSDGRTARNAYTVETSGRITGGGLVAGALPRTAAAPALQLRRPDIASAARIAEAINAAIGDSTAIVEDAGGIRLRPPEDAPSLPLFLAQINAVSVEVAAAPVLIVDSRDGSLVAGGTMRVGEAVVSHAGLTLTIGGTAAGEAAPGAVRVNVGASVQDVAAALHAVGAPSTTIAAVFESLEAVGALRARVVIR
jgi:flagellar P-ring protein precursor FlgI